MFLFKSFDKKKTQTLLKLSIERMNLLQNKKKAEIAGLKKTIKDIMVTANTLETGKQEKQEQALVKAEHLLREKNLVEALDILANECDKLLARFALFTAEKTIAKEIEEAVHTLLWASPRVSIPELMKLREQFVLRYGKQVEDDSRADGAGRADVRRKLSHSPPADLELRRQCKMLAEEHSIPWEDQVPAEVDGYALPPPPHPPSAADFAAPPAQALPHCPHVTSPSPAPLPASAAPRRPSRERRRQFGGPDAPPPPPPPFNPAVVQPAASMPPPPPYDSGGDDDHAGAPPPPPPAPGGGSGAGDPPGFDELERKFSALRQPK